MCGGRFYFTVFRSLSANPKVKELLKSVHIWQSYRKNKSGTIFYGPRCIKVALSFWVMYFMTYVLYRVATSVYSWRCLRLVTFKTSLMGYTGTSIT